MGQHNKTELEIIKLVACTLCDHIDKSNEFVSGDKIVIAREDKDWHYYYEKQYLPHEAV